MQKQEQVILKIFGTGQVTIPKSWRDFFGVNTLRATFNEKERNINIKPVRMIELEDTKWVSPGQLKEDLDSANYNEEFKKDLVDGYKKSDFYLKKKK